VRACSELPKLCEFFHIPFQSGDDDVLRAMKRGYTAERYRRWGPWLGGGGGGWRLAGCCVVWAVGCGCWEGGFRRAKTARDDADSSS